MAEPLYVFFATLRKLKGFEVPSALGAHRGLRNHRLMRPRFDRRLIAAEGLHPIATGQLNQ